MKVFVFGNPDINLDNKPFNVAKKLKESIKDIDFIEIQPNEDLPFADMEKVILIDTVVGLKEIHVITEKELDKINLSPSTTAHDFDLGFQLRYLQKLGKLKEVKIIGIPQEKTLSEKDYSLIQSILRKFVAQDIQGS